MVAMVFGVCFVAFRISCFFVFSTFFEQKKTFVLKCLIFFCFEQNSVPCLLVLLKMRNVPFVFSLSSCLSLLKKPEK